MKYNKFLLGVAVCTISSIFWVSCKKNDVSYDDSSPKNFINYKASGALEDKLSAVVKVPMIMSTGFAEISKTFNLRVIPTKGKSGNDKSAPTVSIISPTDGSSVSGVVNISVSASDNVGVTLVQVSIDGVLLGTTSTTPYTFTWDASSATAGTHAITATAADAAGNTATQHITVSINSTIIITPPPINSSSAFRLLMPVVGNQGGEGSCVAFTVAYAGRSAEQYYTTGSGSYSFSSNIFSPEYVYNQTKFGTDCGSGTSIGTVLDFLQNKGVTTWQTLPYSDINGCNLIPTSLQTAEASNYKIASYVKMANTDHAAIKNRLATNHPVYVHCTIDQVFFDLKAGQIWNYNTGSTGFPHGLVICGYDDAKNAFLAMNSWGTGWADSGYCWIDYNFFNTVTSYYVYSMNL